MMDPENVLEGKMAETLVNELLRKKGAGNKVYRFGYEIILQNLTQLEQTFQYNTATSEIIRSIPDFVVVNKKGEPFFVEVKFRREKRGGCWFRKEEWKKLKNVLEYWGAVLILVTAEFPYFRIWEKNTSFPNTEVDNFIQIDEDERFFISRADLKEFIRLIGKYYKQTEWHR